MTRDTAGGEHGILHGRWRGHSHSPNLGDCQTGNQMNTGGEAGGVRLSHIILIQVMDTSIIRKFKYIIEGVLNKIKFLFNIILS